jgi:hypothetical protein
MASLPYRPFCLNIAIAEQPNDYQPALDSVV